MDLLSSNSGQAALKAVRVVYDGSFYSHCNRFSSSWQSNIMNQVSQKYGS